MEVKSYATQNYVKVTFNCDLTKEQIDWFARKAPFVKMEWSKNQFGHSVAIAKDTLDLHALLVYGHSQLSYYYELEKFSNFSNKKVANELIKIASELTANQATKSQASQILEDVKKLHAEVCSEKGYSQARQTIERILVSVEQELERVVGLFDKI